MRTRIGHAIANFVDWFDAISDRFDPSIAFANEFRANRLAATPRLSEYGGWSVHSEPSRRRLQLADRIIQRTDPVSGWLGRPNPGFMRSVCKRGHDKHHG